MSVALRVFYNKKYKDGKISSWLLFLISMNLEPQGYLSVRSLRMIHISIVHWIAKPAVYFGNVISTHLKICWISPTQFGITTVVLQCSVEKSPSRKRVLLLKEGLDIYSNVFLEHQKYLF
jgi:hypothetical protein